MKKQLAALFAAGTLLVTMGAGCSSEATVSTTPTPGSEVATPAATAPEEAKKAPEEKPLLDATVKVETKVKAEPVVATPVVKIFKLTAKKFAFEPSTITVNKGDTVHLNITSADTVHGFSLGEFNVSANIEPGKATSVDFVADKAGTFTFSCSVFCGAGHGDMQGTLIVK